MPISRPLPRLVVAVAALLHATATPAAAQSVSLEGYWTGGGYAEAISGHRERVSCRVRYTRESADVFGVHAVCASQSVKLTQSGTVSRAGVNRFVGDFYNAEFDISGRVRVVLDARLRHVVSGSSQTVTLSSARGSGTLSLSKK